MAVGTISDTYQQGSDYQSQFFVDSFYPKTKPNNAQGSDQSGKTLESSLTPQVRDTFELSPQMQKALDKAQGVPEEQEKGPSGSKENAKKADKAKSKNAEDVANSPEAQEYIAQLKAIDAKVRAHEAAHLAAAGSLARGGASFKYQTGPDGKKYAVAGEVSIDTKGVDGDAEATLNKARRIQRAALAPADPSAQDRAVAASAASMASQAQAEISRQASFIKSAPEKSSPPPQANFPVTQQVKRAYAVQGKLAQSNQSTGATRFDFGV